MEVDPWTIDMEHLVSMRPARSFEETKHWESRCIYQLPASVTNLNKNAYEPQAVSFGPFHHGREKLMAMEEHKHRALVHFLEKSERPLRDYMASLGEVVEELMEAYDTLDEKWYSDKNKFLQLMMVDGCFMLQILRTFTHRKKSYAPNDPIFSNHGIVYVMPDIKRDMLSIANQLPLLVLYKLVELGQVHLEPDEEFKRGNFLDQEDKTVERYIMKMLWEFYFLHGTYIKTFYFSAIATKDLGKCLHVLDFCRRIWAYQNRENKNGRKRKYRSHADSILSVTELVEAGIRIQRSGTPSLVDIAFHHGVFGVSLRLPPITVNNTTETMFLNLLAFERFHVGAGRDVTNYLVFMNNIIRDSNDVSLLCSCGIIQNDLGRVEVVADLFNSVSKDYTIDPDSLVDIVNWKVSMYCSRPWVRWRANVFRTYFSSPWASISVIASVFLFAFTIVQTGYTIFGYYKSA